MNLLPRILVDLERGDHPLTVLSYSLVHGVSESAQLDLPRQPSGLAACLDDLREALGHDED